MKLRNINYIVLTIKKKNIFLIIVSPRILFNDDTSYLTVLADFIYKP